MKQMKCISIYRTKLSLKKHALSSLLLALISFVSCCRQDDGIYTIDLRGVPDINEISLSEMTDDITYIPLSNDSPIGDIYYNTYVYKDHIVINGRDNGVSLFDREGNFISQIGSKGRGPGEYFFCYNIAVDYEGKMVYVRDSREIKIYTFDGDFIRSFDTSQHAGLHVSDSRGYKNFLNDIVYFNSRLFVSVYISGGMAYNDWIVIDKSGNPLIEKLNYIPDFESYMGWGGVTYEYNNKIYYHNHYNDTLFSISSDLSFEPSIILDLGVTIPETREWEQEDREKRFIADINEMFETDNYWIMLCMHLITPMNIEYYYAIVDKDTKEMFFMQSREPSESKQGSRYTGGIVNDLDGGVPFQPERYYKEDGREYMLELISPFTLKEHVASEDFKNYVPKYPEKKQELIELANSLDEMDNLILASVRLK